MADNLPFTPGNGATIGANEIDNVQYQRIKLIHGEPGVNDGDVSTDNPLPSAPIGLPAQTWPGYGVQSVGGGQAYVDEYGALVTRGPTLTDEGSFRANFANSSTAVAIGSCTFTNGSNIVTGTGFDTVDVHYLDYVKLDADAESAWTQLATVDSPTQITLTEPYTGAGGSGAASRSVMKPTTGSGATITVASGQLTISAQTTASVTTSILRDVDYSPLVFRTRCSISQRIANQDIWIGARENAATPRWFARFRATGTTATSMICETGRNPTGAPSASETQTTTITLPNGANTASMRDWRIEVMNEQIIFYVDGFPVANHTSVILQPYDVMAVGIEVINGVTPATNTDIVVDYVTAKNHNKLEIGLLSNLEQIVVAQPPAQVFSYNQAGVIAINTDLLIIDCAQIRSLSIHCTSMGTTGVVTVAWANNDAFTGATTATLYSESGATSTTFNAAVLRNCNVMARYCRLRLTTATTAGTTTITVYGSYLPFTPAITTQPVSGTVTANGNAGAAAHDAAVSGNPVRIAGKGRTSDVTAVANNDTCDLITTTVGALIVRQDAIPENCWSYAAATGGIDNTTTAVTIKAAAAAGIRNFLKTLQIDHDVLGAVTEVAVRDGAAGTVLWRGKLQTPASEGYYIVFDPPLRGTAATLMEFVTLTAVTGDVLVNATGYIAP